MDDLVDFEELIDLVGMPELNDSPSQKSLQEPLSNVLDKMYKEIGESSFIDTLKCDQDETLINLDEFEELFNSNVNESGDNIINTEENVINVVPYELPIDYEEIQPWVSNKLKSLAETDECQAKDLVGFGFGTNIENTENVNNTYDFDIKTNNQVDIEMDKVIDANLTEEIIDLDTFLSDGEVEVAKQEMVMEDDLSNLKNNIITDNSDDGYNSSDFEFISEDEASKFGIITKSKNKQKTMNTKTYPNEAPLSDYLKYSKHRYMPCYAKSNGKFHEIPTGEKYLDMFRGQCAPLVINNLHFMRHKTVLPNTPMAAMYDDLGFTISDDFDENEEEYKEDADVCVQKILSVYPSVNRKRRRF